MSEVPRNFASLISSMDIPNAKALFEALITREKSTVKLFYTPANEVEEVDDELPLTVRGVPGTTKIHQVACLELDSANKFLIWPYLLQSLLPYFCHFQLTPENGSMKFRKLSCYCSHPNSCECFGWSEHFFTVRRK